MQIYKKLKANIVFAIILAMNLNFFNFEIAQATTLTNLQDLISTSEPDIQANHIIQFTTSVDIGDNGYFELLFSPDFGDISQATCSGSNVSTATSSNTVRCTYSSSPGNATSTKIIINNLQNPANAGKQIIQVATYDLNDVEKESGTIAVYIIEEVHMLASVNNSLSFEMATSSDVTEVNGIPITGSSTITTLPFDKMDAGASSTLMQTLAIATNAENGFSCTVQQDGEITNEFGDTINSFDNAEDDTGSTTLHQWRSPLAIPGQANTYGHLGITTDDFSLSSLDFSNSAYVGLNGTNPIEIFYNNGPSDGITLGIGKANIVYTMEISAMQEPGNYESSLTYICTANY